MTWAVVGAALSSVVGTAGAGAVGGAAAGAVGAGAAGAAGAGLAGAAGAGAAGALGAGAAGAAGAGAAGALGSGALAGTAAGTIGAGGAAGALGSTATGALGSSLSAGSVLGSGSLGATGSSILGPGAGGALASGGGKAALGGAYGGLSNPVPSGLLQPMSGGTNLQGAELLQGQGMMMPESMQGSTYLSGEPGSTWSALDGESSWMPSNDTMQKALLASKVYGALKPKQQQKQQRPYPTISAPRFAGAPKAMSRRSPIRAGGLLGSGRLGSRSY
jgi:hypothetical protein